MAALSVITRAAVRELDRRAVEEFGVPAAVLMENAGRGAADILQRVGLPAPVVVCCGKGNNGGDGLVMARHLDLRGLPVKVILLADPEQLHGETAINYAIVAKSGIPLTVMPSWDAAAWQRETRGAGCLVDALLGTGFSGQPRAPLNQAIAAMNAHGAPILAVDVPSGLDCDTGQPAEQTIRAAHTCTFVAAKPGLLRKEAAAFVGQLHVADIGAPRALVEELLRAAGRQPVLWQLE